MNIEKKRYNMQINRLFEILYILINKKHITAKELSLHFEVSVRTIYRDIDILCSAGIPVYTSQGSGGGIFIEKSYILNNSALTDEEQEKIITSLQSIPSLNDIDNSKLISKLSGLFKKNYLNWIEIDFSRWGDSDYDNQNYILIKNSIIGHTIISFAYISSYGEVTLRKICPVKLFFKSSSWYLQGFCLDKKEYRTFKITRMSSLKTNPEIFDTTELPLPPSLEVKKEACPSLMNLKLEFPSHLGYRVYDNFSPEEIEKTKDGNYIVNTSFPHDKWVYSFLLSFGSDVKVLEPEEIRKNLLNEIEKIEKVYKE